MFYWFIAICSVALLSTAAAQTPIPMGSVAKAENKVADNVFFKGMVVTAHPLASATGLAVLKAGGNAFDAAIATFFMLAVVYPEAGNLGGGGFAVCRTDSGQILALDFRETAPAAATADMYLDSNGKVRPKKSIFGHLACGVPGSVAGMYALHQSLGKLTWQELLKPAIIAADSGIILTPNEAWKLNYWQSTFKKYNFHNCDPFVRPVRYGKGKKAVAWRAGDTIYQPALAKTLRAISDSGAAGFYRGWVADSIVAEMQRGNGLISFDDLQNYRAVWRKAISATYKNYTVITMPPPSAGGIALLQLLKILDKYPLESYGKNSIATVHLIAEAEKRVYADRAVYLGDPDFVHIPVDSLLDTVWLYKRMADFNPNYAAKTLETPDSSLLLTAFLKDSLPPEPEETTHFSIIDSAGNAIALTTTLNGGFGNMVVVGGCGFFLNNEMDDFSIQTGWKNIYGLPGSEANKIVPQKRMVSSMTPTIILYPDSSVFLVLGSPGGSTIPTTVLQVILSVITFGQSLREAVTGKRFHCQWIPREILFEYGAFSKAMQRELRKKGHVLRARSPYGKVDAIRRYRDGSLEGVADPRGEDTAAGY